MDYGDYLAQIMALLMASALVVGGIFLVVTGRIRRRAAKGYEMIYESPLVRVQGLFLSSLGIVLGLTIVRILSGIVTIALLLLITLSGEIVAGFVQQKGILVKK